MAYHGLGGMALYAPLSNLFPHFCTVHLIVPHPFRHLSGLVSLAYKEGSWA
jgi:hypothetical protein